MINIINYGTVKTLTKDLRSEGYTIKSMKYNTELNELTLIYDNAGYTDFYTWQIVVTANVHEEEDGMPTVIDITKVSIENIGE